MMKSNNIRINLFIAKAVLFCLFLIGFNSEVYAQYKLPDEVTRFIERLRDECILSGGRPIGSDRFAFGNDFNGDQIKDYLINSSGFSCEGGSNSLYSGSGGQHINIFIGSKNGTARMVFSSLVDDFKYIDKGNSGRLELMMRGTHCGQKNADDLPNSKLERCWLPLVWNKNFGKFEIKKINTEVATVKRQSREMCWQLIGQQAAIDGMLARIGRPAQFSRCIYRHPHGAISSKVELEIGPGESCPRYPWGCE